MEDDEITHWLELPAGMGFVPFSELAHLIAKARFPVAPEDEEYDFAYGFARVNLDEELRKAVTAGLLKVRDPLTHGPHTFTHGFALQSAVGKVSDLRAFLADRGMGVRVASAPHGASAPTAALVAEHGAAPPPPTTLNPAAGNATTAWTPLRRADLLKEFRALEGKRPSEPGKKGKRGALMELVRETAVDKDTLGAQLDKAIEEKKAADMWAQLNTAK